MSVRPEERVLQHTMPLPTRTCSLLIQQVVRVRVCVRAYVDVDVHVHVHVSLLWGKREGTASVPSSVIIVFCLGLKVYTVVRLRMATSC